MLKLESLLSTPVMFEHTVDKFGQGQKDEDWIPKLGSEGGWVVITADAGKQSKRGHKLPDLCREFHVTHLILSSKLHHKSASEKVRWIAAAWVFIETLHDEPPGSRFQLRLKPGKGMSLTVKVERKVTAKKKPKKKPDSGTT